MIAVFLELFINNRNVQFVHGYKHKIKKKNPFYPSYP